MAPFSGTRLILNLLRGVNERNTSGERRESLRPLDPPSAKRKVYGQTHPIQVDVLMDPQQVFFIVIRVFGN